MAVVGRQGEIYAGMVGEIQPACADEKRSVRQRYLLPDSIRIDVSYVAAAVQKHFDIDHEGMPTSVFPLAEKVSCSIW